jgi:hypothetical protein
VQLRDRFIRGNVIGKHPDYADELQVGDLRVLNNTSPSETPGKATVAAPAPAPAYGYHPGTAAQGAGLNGPEDSGTYQELLCSGFIAYQVLIDDTHFIIPFQGFDLLIINYQ